MNRADIMVVRELRTSSESHLASKHGSPADVRVYLEELKLALRDLESFSDQVADRLAKTEEKLYRVEIDDRQHADFAITVVSEARDRVVEEARQRAGAIEQEALDRVSAISNGDTSSRDVLTRDTERASLSAEAAVVQEYDLHFGRMNVAAQERAVKSIQRAEELARRIEVAGAEWGQIADSHNRHVELGAVAADQVDGTKDFSDAVESRRADLTEVEEALGERTRELRDAGKALESCRRELSEVDGLVAERRSDLTDVFDMVEERRAELADVESKLQSAVASLDDVGSAYSSGQMSAGGRVPDSASHVGNAEVSNVNIVAPAEDTDEGVIFADEGAVPHMGLESLDSLAGVQRGQAESVVELDGSDPMVVQLESRIVDLESSLGLANARAVELADLLTDHKSAAARVPLLEERLASLTAQIGDAGTTADELGTPAGGIGAPPSEGLRTESMTTDQMAEDSNGLPSRIAADEAPSAPSLIGDSGLLHGNYVVSNGRVEAAAFELDTVEESEAAERHEGLNGIGTLERVDALESAPEVFHDKASSDSAKAEASKVEGSSAETDTAALRVKERVAETEPHPANQSLAEMTRSDYERLARSYGKRVQTGEVASGLETETSDAGNAALPMDVGTPQESLGPSDTTEVEVADVGLRSDVAMAEVHVPMLAPSRLAASASVVGDHVARRFRPYDAATPKDVSPVAAGDDSGREGLQNSDVERAGAVYDQFGWAVPSVVPAVESVSRAIDVTGADEVSDRIAKSRGRSRYARQSAKLPRISEQPGADAEESSMAFLRKRMLRGQD